MCVDTHVAYTKQGVRKQHCNVDMLSRQLSPAVFPETHKTTCYWDFLWQKDTHLVRQEIPLEEPNSYGYSLQGCDGHLLWLIDNTVSTFPRKMFHLTTLFYCKILKTIIIIFIITTSKTTHQG